MKNARERFPVKFWLSGIGAVVLMMAAIEVAFLGKPLLAFGMAVIALVFGVMTYKNT